METVKPAPTSLAAFQSGQSHSRHLIHVLRLAHPRLCADRLQAPCAELLGRYDMAQPRFPASQNTRADADLDLIGGRVGPSDGTGVGPHELNICAPATVPDLLVASGRVKDAPASGVGSVEDI